MNYKGYSCQVSYDDGARLFRGEVIGLKDTVTFQGTSVDELEQAFHNSVDRYLAWCAERGESPEKTFSGNLRVRMPPELHAKLTEEAAAQKISLNSLIVDKLQS